MSIRLSLTHGIAPAITFCQICGKDCRTIALLGSKADSVMRDLYVKTNGVHGGKNGYSSYGHNRIPSNEPCDECKIHLNNGGCIIIADDIGEFLKLDSDQIENLHGRVGGEVNGELKLLDLKAIKGKVTRIPKAFWVQDEEGNIRLRDPKEWIV